MNIKQGQTYRETAVKNLDTLRNEVGQPGTRFWFVAMVAIVYALISISTAIDRSTDSRG